MSLKKIYLFGALSLVLSGTWATYKIYDNHCNITSYNQAMGDIGLVFSSLEYCPATYAVKVIETSDSKPLDLSISEMDDNGSWNVTQTKQVAINSLIPIDKKLSTWYYFTATDEDTEFKLEVVKKDLP